MPGHSISAEMGVFYYRYLEKHVRCTVGYDEVEKIRGRNKKKKKVVPFVQRI